MTKRTEVINIRIEDTELGQHWTLALGGKVIDGGYKPTLWMALDAANSALGGAVMYARRLSEGEA